MSQRDHQVFSTSGSMSPSNPSSESAIPAIPAINPTYSTFNTVGGDQTNITNNFYVDRNYDQGIGKFNLAHQRLIDIPVQVYQWLSAVIPSANYDAALSTRLENTGEWFINGAQFAQWKLEADHFLWVSGTRTFTYNWPIITGF
jgi:hypothetical protein